MTSQGEVRNFLRTKPLAMRRFQLMALEHIEQRAARIKARRDELHLTQEEVADRMQDIHRERNPEGPADKTRGQMVSDWERAANEPSSRKLELLAAALETTVAELSVNPPERSGPTPDPFAASQTGRPEGTADLAAFEQAAVARHSEVMLELGKIRTLLEAQGTTGQQAGPKRASG